MSALRFSHLAALGEGRQAVFRVNLDNGCRGDKPKPVADPPASWPLLVVMDYVELVSILLLSRSSRLSRAHQDQPHLKDGCVHR